MPPELPDPEELEEMEESERERLEATLEAITLAGSADQVRQVVHVVEDTQKSRLPAIGWSHQRGYRSRIKRQRNVIQRQLPIVMKTDMPGVKLGHSTVPRRCAILRNLFL